MFVIVLLAPFVFLACWAIPFLGTLFSEKHTPKWIAFWILQIFSTFTLFPFLGLFLEYEYLMVLKIILAFALIYFLNDDLVLILL
jgi:hypothetical protein